MPFSPRVRVHSKMALGTPFLFFERQSAVERWFALRTLCMQMDCFKPHEHTLRPIMMTERYLLVEWYSQSSLAVYVSDNSLRYFLAVEFLKYSLNNQHEWHKIYTEWDTTPRLRLRHYHLYTTPAFLICLNFDTFFPSVEEEEVEAVGRTGATSSRGPDALSEGFTRGDETGSSTAWGRGYIEFKVGC